MLPSLRALQTLYPVSASTYLLIVEPKPVLSYLALLPELEELPLEPVLVNPPPS